MLRPLARQALLLTPRRFGAPRFFRGEPGFDFTDLDPLRRWGPAGLPLLHKDQLGGLVSASADTVALQLDKSQGLTVGAEAITNGDFGTGDLTGWTNTSAGTGAPSYSAGRARLLSSSGTNKGRLTQSFATVVGRAYRLTFDLQIVSGLATLLVGTTSVGSDNLGVGSIVAGSYQGFFVATAATTFVTLTTNSTTCDLSYDNVSCKAVSGNPAAQSTASAQPAWQANGGLPFESFDGADDVLLSTLVPAAAMTLAVCARVANLSSVIMGSSGGATSRSFISLNAAGQFSGGWGSDPFTTIRDPGASVQNADFVGLMRANASVVELFVGLPGSLQRVYSAAPNGAGNTSVPYMIGALNSSGTPLNFVNARIYGARAVDRFIADADVGPAMAQLGALAGINL